MSFELRHSHFESLYLPPSQRIAVLVAFDVLGEQLMVFDDPGDQLAIDAVLLLPELDSLGDLSPNPPKDTDGRREESGRGMRELQGK